jgi:transcriptional antiterminator NusG
MSGKELELTEIINSKADKSAYIKCFTPRYESIYKSKGASNVEIKVLFPGYVFIITDTPDKLFYQLKSVTLFSNLLNDGDKNGYEFLSMNKYDEELMENLLDGDAEDIVRISHVRKGADGRIATAKGPLSHYIERIVKTDYKNRRTFIEVPIFNEIKRIKLSIELDGDVVLKTKEDMDYWNMTGYQKKKQERILEDERFHVGDKVKIHEEMDSVK